MSSTEVRHVLDGKCSFADFMLELGRIATISHTDDPESGYSSFLEDKTLEADTSRPVLDRLKEQHAAVSAWNRPAANRYAEQVYQGRLAKYAKDLAAYRERQARHTALIKQVTRWQPPTPAHEIVKDRALAALKEEVDSHRLREPFKPTFVKGSSLKKRRLEDLSWAIEQIEAKGTTKDERAERHAAWMKALRTSLGLPGQA